MHYLNAEVAINRDVRLQIWSLYFNIILVLTILRLFSFGRNFNFRNSRLVKVSKFEIEAWKIKQRSSTLNNQAQGEFSLTNAYDVMKVSVISISELPYLI